MRRCVRRPARVVRPRREATAGPTGSAHGRECHGNRLTDEGQPPDRGPRRRQLPAVLAALLVFTSASVAAAQDVRRVLVLYPVSDGQPGILRFDESLRSAFKASPDTRVEIYNEYLDSARFPDERHQRHLADFLRGKYSGRRLDVVITALAPSLDFVLKYRDELFPGCRSSTARSISGR